MCPIIRWSGRTARPSTCQVRSIVSDDSGSVKPPCSRSVSTIRDSWVVVATYAQTTPPGTRAAATASMHSHGASMSRTTRSTSVTSSDSTRSPTTSRQAGCGSPKKRSTFVLATSAKSARRS